MRTRHRMAKRNEARRSFTLTELLVVVAVISIIASTVMFAMYGAIEEARISRTRTQIAKLNELLMTRWEGYRTRAVRLQLPPAARRNSRLAAIARLHALRDLMRMEMPDRATDVWDDPVIIPIPGSTAVSLPVPSLQREYQRRANWGDDDLRYEDAECLYMIIASMRDIDGNGLDFFHEHEIGDVNDNGMPEILDAWGNPIGFIRWPAGFVAHPGADFTWNTGEDIPSYSTLQQVIEDPERPGYVMDETRDPFDPLRLDDRTSVAMPMGSGLGDARYYFNFALHPLVFSAGPDGRYDIVRFDYDPADPDTRIEFKYFRGSTEPDEVQNDPYSIMPNSGRRLGEPFLDSFGYVDNIHNHAMEGR